MNTISKVEQEVNQIRLRIYEETKKLTPEQNKERLEKICIAAQKNTVLSVSREQMNHTERLALCICRIKGERGEISCGRKRNAWNALK